MRLRGIALTLSMVTIVVVVGALAAVSITSATGSVVSGDVNCSGSVDPIDSLLILKQDAGLHVDLPPGCSAIGSEIGPPPGPTPPAGYHVSFPVFYTDPNTFDGVVTSVTFANSIPSNGIFDPVVAPAGAQFAVVFMSVNNFGSTPDAPGLFSLRLKDSMGRSFTMDFQDTIIVALDAEDYYHRLGRYDTLQPGIPFDMVFIFEVPLDATGLVAEACPVAGC